MKNYNQWLNEKKKPAGAPDWHDSDAPDAEGRFRDLGIKDLAAWLISSRKGDLKKISGALTQQIVFRRKEDPEYAEKMEKVRKEVYKQLGREDLLEKESPYKEETLQKYKKEYEEGKTIPFGVKTSLIAQGMIPHEGGPDKGKKKKTEVYEAQIGVPDKGTDINAVRYGNQTTELFEIAQKSDDKIKNWFIDQGIAQQICDSAPKNDSETTLEDLKTLVREMNEITPDEITFARYVEEHLEQVFIDFLNANKIEATMDEYFRIDGQTESLLFFLKDSINRPRPNQLAYYYNMPLYPLIHSDANSAAYPSGHALTSYVMSEYYARKYPDLRGDLEDLGKRIAKSRELVGLHYPSDQEASRKIAEIIWENNLIEM